MQNIISSSFHYDRAGDYIYGWENASLLAKKTKWAAPISRIPPTVQSMRVFVHYNDSNWRDDNFLGPATGLFVSFRGLVRAEGNHEFRLEYKINHYRLLTKLKFLSEAHGSTLQTEAHHQKSCILLKNETNHQKRDHADALEGAGTGTIKLPQ